VAAALGAWGIFGEHGDQPWGEFLVICAVIAVAALAVFGWAVPRWAGSAAAARAGLILAVLGILTIAVFWSGLPPVLAAGGAVLGWGARERVAGKVAVGLGVLALVLDLLVYVMDMA
jgi:hypothetical protein